MRLSLISLVIFVIFQFITMSMVDCQDGGTDYQSSTGSSNQKDHSLPLDPPRIRISNGVLRGKHVWSTNGKPVQAFLGIPFAEPPVGKLRFKPPISYQKVFIGEFDATNLPNTCPQEDMVPKEFPLASVFNPNTPLAEDCLFLNVWVPSISLRGKRNIFYFIHGGGFSGGSISLEIGDGAILAAETNSIVVSSNYRLGPMGFLYLGTEDAPGNQGLLDQVEALRWIHKHIESFGGDPGEITVMGVSAGGMSTSYHLLSPLSQPLFKRAVVMSGVATAQVAYNSPQESLNMALELAQKANCSEPINPSTALECLRNIDSSVLTKLQFILSRPRTLSIAMVPTSDGHFLHDSPQNLIRNKSAVLTKDVLIGTTENEGSLFLTIFFPQYFSPFKSSTISKEVLNSLIYDFFSDYDKMQRNAIVYEYQDHEHGQDTDGRNERLMSDCFGDMYMTCPSKDFANNWSELGAKYTESDPLAKWMGMKHGDDMLYFFGHALNPEAQYTVEERLLSQRILLLLGNFARTGTPSPNWQPYTITNQVYADLNSKNASSASTAHFGSRARQCAFWNKFLPQLKNVLVPASPS